MTVDEAIEAWRHKLVFDPTEDPNVALDRWYKELVEAMATAGIPEELIEEELDEDARGFVEAEYQSRVEVTGGFRHPGEPFKKLQ